jgi:electron transfer flavoprotein beta subunit
MHVVVCAKAVPSSTEVRMDPKTNTIVRDGRQAVMNPFDASGLEVALRIKERLGARVTVLSMGIPDTVRLLRDALSRGADAGLLLSDRAFAGADTLATSYALSCALNRLDDVSLVVCGKMAVDGDTAQIGPELAGALDMPCLTDVCEVVHVDAGLIRIRRNTDTGTSLVECDLPCVITVSKDAATLRMPSIAGIREAGARTLDVVSAADVGADPTRCGLDGSPTQVVRSFVPERQHEARRLEGTASEQAAQLAELFDGRLS